MPYIWRAYMSDGEIVEEDKDNRYPSSEDLPKDKVARMEYVPLNPNEKPVGVDVNLLEGERFFRFWRRNCSARLMGHGLLPTTDESTVCVVGVTNKDGEKIVSVYIYPDNTVVVSTSHEL